MTALLWALLKLEPSGMRPVWISDLIREASLRTALSVPSPWLWVWQLLQVWLKKLCIVVAQLSGVQVLPLVPELPLVELLLEPWVPVVPLLLDALLLPVEPLELELVPVLLELELAEPVEPALVVSPPAPPPVGPVTTTWQVCEVG